MSVNTIGQFAKLVATVSRSLPRDLLGKDVGYWLQNQTELKEVLDRALRRTAERKLLSIDYSVAPTIFDMAIEEHPTRCTTDQIDLNKIELTTTLKKDGEYIGGEENLKRLKATGKRLLDARVLEELFKNPEFIPEEWLKRGAVYFWGTIFRGADGDRCVAYMYWNGERWVYRSRWLDRVWGPHRLGASLATSSTTHRAELPHPSDP